MPAGLAEPSFRSVATKERRCSSRNDKTFATRALSSMTTSFTVSAYLLGPCSCRNAAQERLTSVLHPIRRLTRTLADASGHRVPVVVHLQQREPVTGQAGGV